MGAVVFFCLPLIVFAKRKPSWRNPSADFYPFDWQIEDRKPSEVSKWAAGYQPTDAEIAATDARILARENGKSDAEAEAMAAEAAKAYTPGENPQSVAYNVFNNSKS